MKTVSEATPSISPRKKHLARTAVVTVLAGGLVLGGGVIVANAATGTPTADQAAISATPAASTERTTAHHPLLRALRFFVNGDSSAPSYGDRAAKIAAAILDNHPKLAAKLPDALQADLKALKNAASGDRIEAAKKIRASALDGTYGERIRNLAERLQEHKAK
jgi:hypothetical protein